MVDYGETKTLAGTADTTGSRLGFTNAFGRPSWAKEIIVRNLGATNALKVYDASNTTTPILTVAGNGREKLDGPFSALFVQAAAATTAYEIAAKVG